jgi:hypothetical protein
MKDQTVRPLLSALILASTPALAADVQPLGPVQNGVRLGIDWDSIDVDGKHGQAWVYIDISGKPEGRTTLRKHLMRFDCQGQTMTVLEEVRYASDGEVVASGSAKDEPERYMEVLPGSYGEKLMKLTCGDLAAPPSS